MTFSVPVGETAGSAAKPVMEPSWLGLHASLSSNPVNQGQVLFVLMPKLSLENILRALKATA